MDEKTCETCRHENKSTGEIPCNVCDPETGSRWEPVDTADYVQDVFNRRYSKKRE